MRAESMGWHNYVLEQLELNGDEGDDVTNIAFRRVGMDSLLVRRNTGIFGFRMIVTNRRRKDHEMITQVDLMIS